MSLVNKINAGKEKPTKDVEEKKETMIESKTDKVVNNNQILSEHELEFLIRLIGDSNFKGKDLMFIFELVQKLQNFYLEQKGAK